MSLTECAKEFNSAFHHIPIMWLTTLTIQRWYYSWLPQWFGKYIQWRSCHPESLGRPNQRCLHECWVFLWSVYFFAFQPVKRPLKLRSQEPRHPRRHHSGGIAGIKRIILSPSRHENGGADFFEIVPQWLIAVHFTSFWIRRIRTSKVTRLCSVVITTQTTPEIIKRDLSLVTSSWSLRAM